MSGVFRAAFTSYHQKSLTGFSFSTEYGRIPHYGNIGYKWNTNFYTDSYNNCKWEAQNYNEDDDKCFSLHFRYRSGLQAFLWGNFRFIKNCKFSIEKWKRIEQSCRGKIVARWIIVSTSAMSHFEWPRRCLLQYQHKGSTSSTLLWWIIPFFRQILFFERVVFSVNWDFGKLENRKGAFLKEKKGDDSWRFFSFWSFVFCC